MNSFTLNPIFFEIKEVFTHLLYEKVPENYLYTSQQVYFKKSYVCLESHFAEVLVQFIPSIKNFFLKLLGKQTEQNGCDGQYFDKIKYSG